MKRIGFFFYIFSILVFGMAAPALSFATEKIDIVSGLNTLPLLVNKISGDTTIAIIYDPADPRSHADAEHVKAIIDGGIKLSDGSALSTIIVGVNELGKLSRARIAFLGSGLGKYFDTISIAASAASILTITTDIGCVTAAKCIIGVSTSPKTTIYYSKQAADSAKIEFSQAFSMLAKQP